LINAGESSKYMPIKALNTYSKDWTIQARVINKSEKKINQ